jgi:hypothetical protein
MSKSMQFVGDIAGFSVLILLDSGSFVSFVSLVVADQLPSYTSPCPLVLVQVANGARMRCDHELVNVTWSIQDHQFMSTFKVLELQHYDMIVGMDWLSAYSPMTVHWADRWLSIPHGRTFVKLYGVQTSSTQGAFIQLCRLVDLLDKDQLVIKDLPVKLQHIIDQYSSVFDIPKGLPPVRDCDHRIPLLPGARPVQMRPYWYAPALKTEIEAQVAEMLASGLIQHSKSPFASSVILVKKKDNSYHFCVDYRHLNALTTKSKFHVPIIDELLDELSGAAWFSTLDLHAGFHQIRMDPSDQHKTAFQTHHGHFEFRVMAFGLTGAPATFQGAMNRTLQPLLRKCVLVFFDDILVYSDTWDNHLLHLEQVLQLLRKDQWQVKLTKCSFAQQEIAYLGHVISKAGVATDPTKIVAISSWPPPHNIKDLRGFLGLAGYYRKFVKNFGVIAKPLSQLLKKGAVFVWTDEQQIAFALLKTALSTAHVLAIPNFSKHFAIETDASGGGIGAVLIQDHHPLAYISKPLSIKNMRLSAYEKEYLAILLAVDHWRPYLPHRPFLIYSDQWSLFHLTEQRLKTPWQQKVFTKLLGLQYQIVYKKGVDNGAADALSRRPHHLTLAAISVSTPQWLSDVVTGYTQDPKAMKLRTELAATATPDGPYQLQDGLIKYKGRIWLGSNTALHNQVISSLHDSAVGGHSGFPVTYRRVKQLFAWPAMKSAVHDYVRSCTVCAQSKPDRVRYPGLLQPLPVPSHAWQVVSLDFIEGLPRSGKFNCILLVVDKFSKFSHFLALSHPFTASKVAQVFLDSVYRLHGLPEAIISDRDRIFTSTIWQGLFKLTGTSLRMSTSYHPQTDGQTERVNQCLETFLRCFVSSHPCHWTHWLPLAEFWFNTSFHSSLGKSPFEVLYGRLPWTLGLSTDAAISSTDLQQWLS